MGSYLDLGYYDILDADGNKVPRRHQLKVIGATIEDTDESADTTVITVEGGGGGLPSDGDVVADGANNVVQGLSGNGGAIAVSAALNVASTPDGKLAVTDGDDSVISASTDEQTWADSIVALQAKVQTTDDSTITPLTVDVPLGTSIQIIVEINAQVHHSPATGTFSKTMRARYINSSGTAVLAFASDDDMGSAGSGSTMDASLDVFGAAIQINVTGNASQTVDWHVLVRTTQIGDEIDSLPITVTSVYPPVGFRLGAGIDITITGTGFEEGNVPAIDGIDCTDIVVVDSTTITCKTPTLSAKGFYDVTVDDAAPLSGGYLAIPAALCLDAAVGWTAAQWDDQSDNARNATQGTAGSQPTRNASNSAFNNQPTINFDGVDDSYGGNIAMPTNNFAVYMVFRFTANGPAGLSGVFSMIQSANATDNSAGSAMILRASNTTVQTYQNSAAKSVNTIANNTAYVLSTRSDGTNNVQRVNTTDGTTVAATGTLSVATYRVGARWQSSAPALWQPMELAFHVALPANTTTDEDAFIRSYFETRFGIAS